MQIEVLHFGQKFAQLIIQDPRAPNLIYFLMDKICTIKQYQCVQGTYTYPLSWADCQFSGTRYYRYLRICTHFTNSLRTDSYVSCKEYCKIFEINTARHLLLAIFIARYFKYRKQKTQPYLQSETLFLCIIFRGLLNIFCKLPD